MSNHEVRIDCPPEVIELVEYYASIGAHLGEGAVTTIAITAAALGWKTQKVTRVRNLVKHHPEWGIHLSSRMGRVGNIVLAMSEMIDGVPTGKLLIGAEAAYYAADTVDRGIHEAAIRFGIQALQAKTLQAGQLVKRGLTARSISQTCKSAKLMLTGLQSGLDVGPHARSQDVALYDELEALIAQL